MLALIIYETVETRLMELLVAMKLVVMPEALSGYYNITTIYL